MHKHTLKALGLSLIAALGLMAFSAGAAQAGEIQVEGSAALATGRTVNATQEGEGTLLVPSLNIEIVCKKLTAANTTVTSGPLGTASAEVLYEECVVWSIQKETEKLIEVLTSCQILASGATKTKGHITAKGVGKIILHNANTETFLLAEGAPFATVEFTKGIGCALTNPVKVSGAVVFKVVTGNLIPSAANKVVKPLIEASKTLQKLIGDKLLYGVNEAFIDGSALLELTGSHAGLKWGAL
jgi:hypothetical protein